MTRLGSHVDARAARARHYYREFCGEAGEAKREAEIEALQTVQWRGRTLRTLRCHGDFGKGPHDIHVPGGILWALIDLRRFICPFHR